jgi:hypothetical protein
VVDLREALLIWSEFRKVDGSVRLYSRNAIDWTARLPAIAAAARRIKAKKAFTISRSTARRLYWGPTVWRYSTSCAGGKLPRLR